MYKTLMSRLTLASFLVIMGGCSIIDKWTPSEFDAVEYGMLVELNVIAMSPLVKKDWCHPSHISRMSFISNQLVVYSTHRLNTNIQSIYGTINETIMELKAKENPSDVYCKLKRRTIHGMTTDTLQVFGDRK